MDLALESWVEIDEYHEREVWSSNEAGDFEDWDLIEAEEAGLEGAADDSAAYATAEEDPAQALDGIAIVRDYAAKSQAQQPESFARVPEVYRVADSALHSPPEAWIDIGRELIETERKYIDNLEMLQNYVTTISQTVGQDTIDQWFPELADLIRVQRALLARLEVEATSPWPEQRWGRPFVELENQFAVYEPWSAHYQETMDQIERYADSLLLYNHIINVRYELPAFVIRPVSRICKYPLLLQSFIKAASCIPHYLYSTELEEGLVAAQRVAERSNDAIRRSELAAAVRTLQRHVLDWKGRRLQDFGELILEDVFMLEHRDGVQRERHLYLFEHALLCCKKVYAQRSGYRGGKKIHPTLLRPVPHNADVPLKIKGLVLVKDIQDVIDIPTPPRLIPPIWSLQICWRDKEGSTDDFTLHCRSGLQLRRWSDAMDQLVGQSQADPPGVFMEIEVRLSDVFRVLRIPAYVDYDALVARIRAETGVVSRLLRVRYRDMDGDLITVGSAEDLETGLEACSPTKPLALLVTELR